MKKQQERRKAKKKEPKKRRTAKEKEAVTPTITSSTESRTLPAVYDPQINPSLQQIGTSTHIEHITNQVAIPIPEDGGYVDDNGMRLLIGSGYENTILVNGPNDGPPKYYVSAAALKVLSQLTSTPSHINSETEHMEPDRPSNEMEQGGPSNEPTQKVGGNSKRQNEDLVEQPRRSNQINKTTGNGEAAQITTRSHNNRGKGRKKYV